METLKRQRTLMRSVFTRNVNSINELLDTELLNLDEINVSFEILEQKAYELHDVDNKIRELLLENENTTENEFLTETNQAEKYVSTFKFLKLKVQKLLKEDAVSLGSSAKSSTGDRLTEKRKFKLPQIAIRKFNGNLIDWLPFWSQFEKIHNDNDIVPEDKFQYLLQCVIEGTRAYDLVHSFPPIGANYSKVIECLKSRFGKTDLLIEVYVRELLKIVLQNGLGSNNTDQISIQALYDQLESHLRNLETLGVTTDKCASLLYPMVESCLPEHLLRAWQRSTFRTGETPEERLNSLMKFMLSEVESEERIGLAMSGFGVSVGSVQKDKSVKKTYHKQTKGWEPVTASSLVSTSRMFDKPLNCIFCEKHHKSSDCFAAQKMVLDEKTKILKDKNCCFCCLQPGHGIKRCKISLKCPLCKKRHFIVMCPNIHSNKRPSVSKTHINPTDTSKPEPEVRSTCFQDNVLSNINKSTSRVFMQTVVVQARNPINNASVNVRVLFDSGSERSYIDQSLASRLEYMSLGQESIVHSLFGNVRTAANIHDKFRVYLTSLDNSYKCNFEVLNTNQICGKIIPVIPGPWIEELAGKNIQLTDTDENCLPINLLIGADVAGKLFTGEKVQLDSGLVAMNTLLGWTLMGKLPGVTNENNCLSTVITNMFIKDASITDLWSLDLIGIKEAPEQLSKKENELNVKKHFLETTDINQDKRYEVRLPWIENHAPLPSNQKIAEKRLLSVSKRLKSNNLYMDYDSVFKDWLSQGIIEMVPTNEVNKDCHYLPHRPVVKEHSQTTRIRPVFDASARAQHMPSLNDCLESGPNLIELIPTVMLRFRERKYGVIADIAKAFLQIAINPEDTDKLRFLWYDESGEISIYRHKRLVFGVKCSPFLLGAVINLHLYRAVESLQFDPKLVQKLQKSFYVDNVSTSVDTPQELDTFVKESTKIMVEGKFDLRQWKTTCCREEEGEKPIANVLGVKWDYQEDSLFVGLECLKDLDRSNITKRTILSISHRIFDPIGFVSPVTLYPKLLLQKMWTKKIEWDSKVDQDSADKFLTWFDKLHALQDIKIPRWIGYTDAKSTTIHTFCDGSKDAYAAVIFIRVERENEISVQLLAAKSRVAPLKSLTIPKLELMAATIGVRLTETIVQEMNWKVPVYYWTDSTTVLGWIRQDCNWKVFVWNRISEIKKFSKTENWNYIQGEHNPADLPSRGCNTNYLLKSRWWEGPKWMKSSIDEWPVKTEVAFDLEEINLEKKNTMDSVTRCMINVNCVNWYSQYFSKFRQIVRLLAWITRFVKNCRVDKEMRMSGELITKETEDAEKKLFMFIQKEAFHGIDDKNISCMDPFIDEDGLIRIKTKLSKNEDTTFGVRFPILLPANHPTVKLLILDCHNQNCHAGVQILLNIMRDNYWILGGRRTLRNAISSCITCKRHKSKRLEPLTGTLPMDRMRDCGVFEVTGTDLAGPLYLKRSEKAWVCIFTCAVYRAVHLELITSLSSDAFLQALRRFIARRGRPSTIYSDNGTNYVGAKNSLNRIDWTEINKFSTAQHIHWKLIPSASPWWGGWWERMVRIIKELLRRVLGRANINYQEMTTILCDCESVINTRPLTYIYDRMEELTPLTPNHFLQDIRESGVPDLDKLEDINLNKRFKYLQTLKQELRQRFKKEYLGQLIQKINIKSKTTQLHVGDVVLIECNNLKRVDWPLAIVEEVMPSKEAIVRVAKVRTSQGVLIRPIQKLYCLEISCKDAEQLKRKVVNVEPAEPKKETDKKNPEEVNPAEPETDMKTRYGRRINMPKKYDLYQC